MHRERHRTAHLIDRLIASDPSLERLRSGVRALLTSGILAALFLLVPPLLGLEYKLTLAGILVPMIAAVALQQTGRRQQQATMAWVPFVASAVLVLASLVGGKPWLSAGCFVLVIFASFQARRFGPRGSDLGTLAYQSYFYGLLLKTPPSKAAWLPLFVFVGCAVAYAIRFWLVPEHPGRMLRSELRAWRARIAALLHALARQLERGGDAGRKRITFHLAQANAQSLGLESRLGDFSCEADVDGSPAAALRVQVLRSELAAETIAAVARAAVKTGAEERRLLAGQLHALERQVGDGKGFDPGAWKTRLDEAGRPLPSALRWRLRQAVGILAGLPSAHQALPAMRDERKPAQAGDGAPEHDTGGRRWLDDITRRALQACAASLGAILAGRALSPSHWYWAVFAAFVVFTRTITVGQALSSAWRRVLATVAGVCVGIAAAELVHGDRAVELSLLFVFIAAGFYAFRGLQNAYVVLLSAMLAMLYELMGMNSPGLLVLRLEETVVGAAAAILSARLVLPVHTRDESRGKSAELLRAAAGLLRSAWAAPDSPAQHGAIRELDRTLQALRQTLGPVTGADYPGAKKHRRRHLQKLSRIVYCVRHCCGLALHQAPRLARSARLREAACMLAARLEDTAALFDGPDRHPRPAAATPLRPAPDDQDIGDDADGDSREAYRLVARWLAETDETLRAMHDDMTAPDKA